MTPSRPRPKPNITHLLTTAHPQQYFYKVSALCHQTVWKEFDLQAIFGHKTKSWPWPSRSRSHITPPLTSSHPQQYFYKVSAFYIKRFGRSLIYKLFSGTKLSPDLDLQGQGHISHLCWHPLILSNISTKFRLSTLNGLEGVWSTSYFRAQN